MPRTRIDEAVEDPQHAAERTVGLLSDALGIPARDLEVCVLPAGDGFASFDFSKFSDVQRYAEEHLGL